MKPQRLAAAAQLAVLSSAQVHTDRWSGLANGATQPAGAGRQPPRPLVGVRWYLEVVGLVVGRGLGGPPLDDDGRPAVPRPNVRGALGERPRRTRRRPVGRVGVVHRLGELRGLGLELGVVAAAPQL